MSLSSLWSSYRYERGRESYWNTSGDQYCPFWHAAD